MKIIRSNIAIPKHSYKFSQPIDQIVFFDIETTGLSPKASSLYLIGAMHYDSSQNQWILTQWFADDYRSEATILEAFLEYLTSFQVLYHFNGATFDIPYILQKCQKHHITIPDNLKELFENILSYQTLPEGKGFSVDLLKEIRPLKKPLLLAKANQTALEHWLGIQREDKYNGGELITVYAEYMQKKILHPTEADALEKVLLLHNHDDMAGMLEVCSMLSFRENLSLTEPVLTNIEETPSSLKITFLLPQSVPRQVTLSHVWEENPLLASTPAILSFEDTTGILSLPLVHTTLKHFFADYKNYFYLPSEDCAMHKSVAQFVDSQFRQKATAATCYTKKEGSFLPCLSKKPASTQEPLFYQEHKAKPAFYLLASPNADALQQQMTEYLRQELPHF